MSEHDDEVYLHHIDRMAMLLGITKRIGRARFDSEPDVRDATIYRLQTLAESTQKLSAGVQESSPRRSVG